MIAIQKYRLDPVSSTRKKKKKKIVCLESSDYQLWSDQTQSTDGIDN